MDWERMCRELQKRVEELENENRELRRRLGLPDAERSRIDAPEQPAIAGAGVHMRSTPEEKIRLFRRLFRGREDVFARRWYSTQKEKGGYWKKNK